MSGRRSDDEFSATPPKGARSDSPVGAPKGAGPSLVAGNSPSAVHGAALAQWVVTRMRCNPLGEVRCQHDIEPGPPGCESGGMRPPTYEGASSVELASHPHHLGLELILAHTPLEHFSVHLFAHLVPDAVEPLLEWISNWFACCHRQRLPGGEGGLIAVQSRPHTQLQGRKRPAQVLRALSDGTRPRCCRFSGHGRSAHDAPLEEGAVAVRY